LIFQSKSGTRKSVRLAEHAAKKALDMKVDKTDANDAEDRRI